MPRDRIADLRPSERGEDVLARDTLGDSDLAQDGVERADAQRLVIGHRDAVMRGVSVCKMMWLPTSLTFV